ncbi:ABC transporter permease [Ferrovibrio sp.]|uniref:ABC transporter permease n=1 Tax=Ferrovibrio sp. TaxID=1917215 RepID=UPI0035B1F046
MITTGRILLGLALLACWEWGHRVAGNLFVASPMEVVQRLREIVEDGSLWGHAASTLWITALGFAIGFFFGVLLPFLLDQSERATKAIEPAVLASMGIPKFALAPLLILWFGIGDAPKVVIIAFMTFYMIFISTFSGLRGVDHKLIVMAKIVGADPMNLARDVLWRSLQPYMFAGLKVALPRALSAAIVGEFLVADKGLGYMIEHARQMGDTTGVFTGIVVVTALVLGLNWLLERLQAKVMAWRPKDASVAH